MGILSDLVDGAEAWLRDKGKNSGINLSGAQKAVQGDGGGSAGYSGPIDGGAREVRKPRHEASREEEVARPGSSRQQTPAEQASEAMSEDASESSGRAAESLRSQGAPVKETTARKGSGAGGERTPSQEPARATTPRTSSSKACADKGRPKGYTGSLLKERCVNYEDKRLKRKVEAHLCDFQVTSSKTGDAITASALYFVAYDFMLMAEAFKKEMRKTLQIRGTDSHFRTFEQQEKQFLANYRQNSRGEWVRHGVTVANPYTGTSNHQRGLALDIEVGNMPKDERAGGAAFANPTEIYNWLEKNGPLYGFDNDEGRKAGVREPWHWAHPGDKLYGIEKKPNRNRAEERARLLAQAGAEGPARADTSASAAKAAARARADTAASADKISAAANAVGTNAAAADYARRRAAAARLQVGIKQPPNYKLESTDQLFDYKTGKWGDDGRRV